MEKWFGGRLHVLINNAGVFEEEKHLTEVGGLCAGAARAYFWQAQGRKEDPWHVGILARGGHTSARTRRRTGWRRRGR